MGDQALADATPVPARLDDLEILARVRSGATTLHAHEHALIIDNSVLPRKKEVRSPGDLALHFASRAASCAASARIADGEIAVSANTVEDESDPSAEVPWWPVSSPPR